jgi:osmotically-inducible protein OsmY
MRNQRQLPALALMLCLSLLAASRATGQNNAINLTSKFLKGGIRIDHLLVYSLSGIVVLRGSTSDQSKSLQALHFARKLGYKRIANLIQITSPPDDAAIIRSAERQLDQERALGGCRFHIESKLGVVHLTGRIHRRIDGVKEVHPTFTYDVAKPPPPRKRS